MQSCRLNSQTFEATRIAELGFYVCTISDEVASCVRRISRLKQASACKFFDAGEFIASLNHNKKLKILELIRTDTRESGSRALEVILSDPKSICRKLVIEKYPEDTEDYEENIICNPTMCLLHDGLAKNSSLTS